MVITTLILNARAIGMVLTTRHSAGCTVHRDSDAINSIITQKQLYLTKKTVRTSGTVLGELRVGQTRLTVQLAVGSQRTASRSGWDLL